MGSPEKRLGGLGREMSRDHVHHSEHQQGGPSPIPDSGLPASTRFAVQGVQLQPCMPGAAGPFAERGGQLGPQPL